MVEAMMSLSTLVLALSIAQAGPQEDLLLAADDSKAQELRMDAFFRLVRQGASDLSLVLEVAQDAEAPMEQRWIAIRVLGRVDGNVATRMLLDLVDNSAAPVRAASMEALGDQGNQTYATAIIPGLKDPAIVVRVSAATALAALRSPEAIDALDDALQDQSNYRRGQSLWVRRYYVLALGSIGSKDAYPALLRCLDDGDERVVEESIVALEGIAGFSYAEGRDREEQRQAWRRWTQSRLP
jgi:HEAT repeat protein